MRRAWTISAWIYLTLCICGWAYGFSHGGDILNVLHGAHYDKSGAKFGSMTDLFIDLLCGAMLATLFHQLFIYLSYHDMENERDRWHHMFPRFFGSGGEIVLRILAFLSLMYASGKLHPLVEMPIIQTYFDHRLGKLDTDSTCLVVGSAALFLFHLIWDIFALRSQFRCSPSTSNWSWKDWFAHWAPILGFIVSDGLAFVISACIVYICSTNDANPVAEFMICLVSVFYVIGIILRVVFGSVDIIRRAAPPAAGLIAPS